MLKINEITNIIKELSFDVKDYWVTSGASLVIHGVKESTRDIDLGCTTKLTEELIEKGYKYKYEEDNTRTLYFNEYIELFENWFVDEIEMINGIPVASLKSIIKQKQKLGREKDFRDIKMIKEFINNRKL
ncbi:hypothetical protein PV797_09905 [Clostridiaceae bacterium M8S5]|nr:hypothetical protein PV797_09905 [Clostridiaceae bacterium M8S5]